MATNEEQPAIQNTCPLFELGVGIEIKDINIEGNSDMIEQNQEEHNESIHIRDNSLDQVIVNGDDLDISLSNDQGSSIDQNNDSILLSSINEDTLIIHEDIDDNISKDTKINNEDEKVQDDTTYDLTEALQLKHYEESYSDVNENDEHSSTRQSLDKDFDQQDEFLEKDSTVENEVRNI